MQSWSHLPLRPLTDPHPSTCPSFAASEEIPARRLLGEGHDHAHEEAVAAPAPAPEDALIEGAAVMRAAMEAGFELTPEELALLELETAAPAPAPGESQWPPIWQPGTAGM